MINRDKKLEQIINWTISNDSIRAVLLTSSLANPGAPVDRFSDLDVELVVDNLQKFYGENDWLSQFGKVIARLDEDTKDSGSRHLMRMVLYDDYVKVDFRIYDITEFLSQANNMELPVVWDAGYRVLVDKDNLAANMKPPTYQSLLIKRPAREEFIQLLNDFWWDLTYVAKCLARDEIFYAKFMTENLVRAGYLCRLIEWYIAIEFDWKISTNKHGRLFKKYLSPELWERIEATFSGGAIEDNWRGLNAIAETGSELGSVLAGKLGYTYPAELEANVRKYMEFIRESTN